MLKFVSLTAIGGAVALLAPLASASAVTYTATASTVGSIFSGATSGDTIKMIGTFGQTRLQDMVFAKGVTLDARQAVFTDTLELVRLSGVRVIGGRFDVASRTTRDAGAAVVYGGSNIAFDRPTITGDASESGIYFAGVNNVRVTSGSFTGLHVGINLAGVSNGFLSKNAFIKADSDGIDIGDSHRVSATYNSCSGSVPGVGAHPDCIQMWSTAGHPLQSDNIVSDNIATGATQGFTSFSGGGGGIRLSILRNTVNTSYPQGIACYSCIDSNISYNKITTLPGSEHTTSINVVDGRNNTVVGNTVGNIPAVKSARNFYFGFVGDEIASTSTAIPFTAGQEAPEVQAELPFDFGVTSVAEPGTWAMLIVGFGLIGVATRRRAPRQAAA